jgi:hypothetical protein
VEGRNGHLSLYHHGCHRFSDRKLGALTAIHNFHILRPDGTTAAERFFGRAHPPLFEQVLRQVSFPPPPRQRPPRNYPIFNAKPLKPSRHYPVHPNPRANTAILAHG